MICPQPYSLYEIYFYCLILWNAKFFRNESKVTGAETPLWFVYSEVFLGTVHWERRRHLLAKSNNTAQPLDVYKSLVKEGGAGKEGSLNTEKGLPV